MRLGVTLETGRQRIRHFRDDEADRRFFHRMSSDDAILRFFAQRWTRAEADSKLDEMNARTRSNGFGWAIAELRDTGEPVGLVGLGKLRIEEITGPGVEIGWRYVPEAWGRGLATEAALALRDHGFRPSGTGPESGLGLERLLAMAVPDNHASLGVMRRIGMLPVQGVEFDHPLVPDTHPQLKRHVLWAMEANAKESLASAGPA
ncbi:RimJ/RimL family protein N-acetyltransferase [Hoeflea marina]|uniref:RimJ/RimL family protein N-acetyltransferase n=1 Tax=Hoeflea marina TaxID=274592 RepID=A0A317PI93_9HYPH|nr:GNAT family N-acetyltransferase [Hoeflea marina]PWV99148.1 RimJ/RimL family protein N-acetyltransferase [Hoeflea marina]